MTSLRDIGYNLSAAVADIVDNSLAARSTRVDIDFQFNSDASWIRIADNGHGMAARELDEAMRYGTQRSYHANDLGRFGLGLKTASLSQCQLLSVASRRGVARRRIQVRQWDLKRVTRRNAWELLSLDIDEAPPELTDSLLDHTGTVVLWEELDRLMSFEDPAGGRARNALSTAANEVRDHLSMVYHRLISGETSRKEALVIAVNGSAIQAWDPFARAEKHTEILEPQRLTVDRFGEPVTVLIQPFILPSQHRFSTSAAHMQAGGPNRWNRQQGFYFYRQDRLLQAGGWNRVRTSDEHTKLARIAVDIPAGADEVFGINVAKMRVTIPTSLRADLTAIASGVSARAAAVYRRQPSSVQGHVDDEGSERNGHPNSNGRSSGSVTYPLLMRILNEELANQPQKVARILKRLQEVTDGGPVPSKADAMQPFVIRRRRRPSDSDSRTGIRR